MFTRLELLVRPKGLWTAWQPRERIEPSGQLEFKNPVIREYTEQKCDLPISNQGEE